MVPKALLPNHMKKRHVQPGNTYMETNKTQLVRHGTAEHTGRDKETTYNAIDTANKSVKSVIEIAVLERSAAGINFRLYSVKNLFQFLCERNI